MGEQKKCKAEQEQDVKSAAERYAARSLQNCRQTERTRFEITKYDVTHHSHGDQGSV